MVIAIFSDKFIMIQYVLVIGFLSPHVRHAVDAESYVQIYAEAEVEVYPERDPQRFRPEITRNSHR